MIFSVRSYQNCKHISLWYSICGRSASLAIIESNLKDPESYSEESGFDEVLLRSVKRLPRKKFEPDFPKMMACSVQHVIEENNVNGSALFHVGFTALIATKEMVWISSVGNTRVHLVSENERDRITREHNLKSDFEKVGITLPDDPGAIESLKHIESRQITARGFNENDIDNYFWKVNGNYTLLVLSQLLHGFRSSEEYLRSRDQFFSRSGSARPGIGAAVEIVSDH
ncbi:MAG: hypothetical protein OEM82_08250 [Acidobacteriota bacterium]|nr:hypothetical protein [Acidobacteriota bacterium]MDH3531111.1 hypothetical protein [Acidobacteriota bacterium]